MLRRIKKLNLTDLNLLEGRYVYICDSSFPCYRRLWIECENLFILSSSKIFSFITVSGTVCVNLKQDCPYNSITHLGNLGKFSPKFYNVCYNLDSCYFQRPFFFLAFMTMLWRITAINGVNFQSLIIKLIIIEPLMNVEYPSGNDTRSCCSANLKHYCQYCYSG